MNNLRNPENNNNSVVTLFSDRKLSNKIIKSIHKKTQILSQNIRIMHICGTHEATVARSGMRSLLPPEIEVIAGPGCPVCICPADHVSNAISLAEQGHIIVTFGDMFKVPDVNLITLAKAKSKGRDIRVVYSVMDAVNIARKNPEKQVTWLGVGFETTAPMTSFVLEHNPPENFYVLSDFRIVPPAMELLAQDSEFDLHGFILPGHVSTVTGSNYFKGFAEKHRLPCVIAGFEPLDFLIGIDRLLDQLLDGQAFVDNAYPRAVTPEGNIKAQESMRNVFEIVDARWRGIGVIPKSGFELKQELQDHNARHFLDQDDSTLLKQERDLAKGCLCGKVILGQVKPKQCPHFLRTCTPETPLGPCMVSDEGTCRIHAKYSQE